jgi:hypothetical protein
MSTSAPEPDKTDQPAPVEPTPEQPTPDQGDQQGDERTERPQRDKDEESDKEA